MYKDELIYLINFSDYSLNCSTKIYKTNFKKSVKGINDIIVFIY